jgi:hypothetical protein
MKHGWVPFILAMMLVASCSSPHGGHSPSPSGPPAGGRSTPADTSALPGVASVGVPPGTGPTNSPVVGTTNRPNVSTADLEAAQAILLDVKNHGWDACTNGLAVNWKQVNNTTVDDWNGTGHPDATGCTRHEDRMTTLRLLHSYLLYGRDTGSSQFDTTITLYENHVLALFAKTPTDQRGWAWWEFTDIAQLSGDPRFSAIADAMVADWYKSLADSSRPDYQFEEAAALVESGVADYVTKGKTELAQLWSNDYDPKTGLVTAPVIKSATEGDIAVALARAGMTAQAKVLETGMASMWDSTYGGYAESATEHNGTLVLDLRKTGGRMMNMLELGKLLSDATLTQEMQTLFLHHVYQTQPKGYEGVLYEQTQNWGLVTQGGVAQDWVTSEAIGISLVALLS